MVETGQFTFIFSTHTKGKIKHVCLVQLNERNYFQLKWNLLQMLCINTDVLILAGRAID